VLLSRYKHVLIKNKENYVKTNLNLFLIIISVILIFSCTSAQEAEEAVEPGKNTSPEVSLKPDDVDLELIEKKEGVEKPAEDTAALRGESIDDAAPMVSMMEDEIGYSESESKSVMASDSPTRNQSTHSGLKAGFSDDNRQYGYYLDFLAEYRQQVTALDLNVSERIMLKVTDRNGSSLAGAKVVVSTENEHLTGLTLADGSYQINPSELSGSGVLSVEINAGDAYELPPQLLEIERSGARSVESSLELERVVPEPIPLDIVFVMDTTGSMGEEIHRLKETIQIIHMNLTSLRVPAKLRFGMVLYKDSGDEYDSMRIPLTSDLELFQAELDLVEANGGGDMPEDLELALDDLINGMEWNPGGIKLAYIITDAPPHLDYGRSYTCSRAAEDARKMGIKIYGIGTGGLDLQGEYVLRQIAQYTSARYIFLTYGSESGDSEGGADGSVSHHTGSNWSADKLESIIIRFAKEELSYLSDSPLLDEDSWFEADKIDTEDAEETLSELFTQAVNQLLDFSTWPVSEEKPLAVLPFQYEGDLGAVSEYFSEHFILSAGMNERITLAERKDLGQLLSELELQNTGITMDDKVSEIGELLNAEALVSGNLFLKDGKYELFLKLLRTETAEVLSVTRAVIAAELGL